MSKRPQNWWAQWLIIADEATTRVKRVLLTTGARHPSSPALQMSNLESRILFSATPIDPASLPGGDQAAMVVEVETPATDSDSAIEQTATEQTSEQSVGEIVFIDSAVPDIAQLLDDLSSSGRDAEVFLLRADRDGVDQITEILDSRTDIDSIHIVSHAQQGAVKLGNVWLGESTLSGYAGQIASWQISLTTDADILLYGCDLASDQSGQTLVDAISALTGADVAASIDDTGHAHYGGDWDLEYSVGVIESNVAFSHDLQQNWVGKLSAITVDTFADIVNGGDGLTSLREAIMLANVSGGETIDLSWLGAGTFTLSITGTDENLSADGDFDITNDVTIVGVDGTSTIIDATGLGERVFHVLSGTVDISGVTIRGGDADINNANGGGLMVEGGADVTVTNSMFTGNMGKAGGAIMNDGTLSLVDVTIDNNNATTTGGGLSATGASTTLMGVTISNNTNSGNNGGAINADGANLWATNVTISGNSTTANGGGIYTQGIVTLQNVTVTDNTASSGSGVFAKLASSVGVRNTIIAGNNTSADISGNTFFTSQGYNLVGDKGAVTDFVHGVNGDLVGTSPSPIDPLLGILQDNGGFTQTHAITAASPAYNAGTTTGAPSVDQRGEDRVGPPDIGAYEEAANVGPTITLTPGFLNYTENDPATIIDPTLTVTDPDDANLASGEVRIASGYVSGQDLLEFTDQLGITGAWNSGTGILTLTGSSSVANYQTAMRSVTYSNASENPDESLRIINFQVFDGIASSTSLKMTNVAAVNDQPVLNNIAGDSQSYAAGTGVTIVEQGSDVTVGDLDSTDFDTGNLTVSIAAGGDNAEDVLSIRDQGTGAGQIGFDGVNVSYGGTLIGTASGGTTGAPLVVAFNAASVNTAAAALIRNITYENLDAVTPTTGARTVRFVVDDGDGDSSLASDATVTVSAAQNTLVVDTTSDVADGTTTSIAALLGNKGADGKISLREAIAATNNTTNGGTPDEIHFEITDPLSGGAHTIVVTSALPGISDAVIIDGTTDTDFGTTPIIVLDGDGAGSLVDGLTLAVGSDGSTIRSLVVQRFAGDGIEINGSSNNKIEGTHIGTNAAGTVDQGNLREGIHITNAATNNTIGGTTSAQRNVISGNNRDGVLISVGSNGNQLQGNFIGTNAAGTSALGNTLDGLWIEGLNNTIGGVATGAANVISGNLDEGVSIDNGGSGNILQGNLVGTDVSGTLGLGNGGEGVLIIDGTGNVIGGTATDAGNTIAHNGASGVSIDAGNQNAIRGNSIFDNNTLGIDLLRNAVTINDAGDGDAGANSLQNFPVLTAATVSGSDLTITGSLNSTPNTEFDFDFFSSTTADPSGYGEAERYLGSAVGISTDGSGNLTLNELLSGANVLAGEFITATATDQDANTSEFALNVVAMLAANSSPTVANPIPDQGATEDLLFNFQFAANTFDDLDADTLTYTVTLADLSPLPTWLNFDGASRTFSGTPINADVGAITVRVQATDPSMTFATDDFVITVANTNDTPTDVTLDSTSVAENADGAVIGNLVVTDPDVGDTHTWSVDDARFEIVATQLKLKTGQSLDKEFEPTVNLTITATDQGGAGIAYNKPFVITVDNVNESATDITLDNANVNENADGAVIGNLGVVDPDVADTHTWSVDNARFEIVATQLKLKTGQSLDKEFEPTVNLTITATDQGGAGIAYNKPFVITVDNVNESATDITLDSANVNENADGAVIGNLGVVDPDVADTHTWSVDDARFEIVATQLKLKTGQSLDKEFEPTVNLTITATDQGGVGIAYNKPFVITVNDVNEIATDITLDNSNVNENADGAVIGNLGIIDPDVGDTHTWSVDDARFEIVGTQLKLKTGQLLNKEFEPTVNLAITATDQGGVGIAYNEAFVITVNDVNEIATDITLDNSNVNENADGAVIGNLGIIDPDVGDTHTWSVDDARFEIVATQLNLKTGQSLDKEFEPTVNLTITATDQGGVGIAYNKPFVITVDDVNEIATDITLDNSNVNENADGAVIGNLGIIDPDVGDTHTWSVDDARFEIIGTQLKLKTGQSLDKEFEPTVNLTITATDQGGVGFAYNKPFVITVNNVNEIATDITLDNSNVNENADGAVIGNLGIIDPDVGDTHIWSVDDARFEIIGTQLKLKTGQSLDKEFEPTVNLTITATDQGGVGFAYNKPFVITVNDVNEIATDITSDNSNVNENADGAVVGNLGIIDPDVGDTHTWSVDDARFEIVATQLKLKPGQSLDKETEPTVNLTITATDQGGIGIAYNEAFVITVDDVNEAPIDIMLGSFDVDENDDGAVIGNLLVTDPDAGDTHLWSVDDARFQVVAGELKLKTGQTLDRETEPIVNLAIEVTDQGGAGLSYTEFFTITVNDVNDAPTADAEAFTTQTGQTLNIAAAGVLAGDTDPDGDLLSAMLVAGPANGSLTLFADGSFVYVPNATFTGVDSYLYQSSDGALVSPTTLVTITVQPLGVPLPTPIPTDTGGDPDDPDPLPPPPAPRDPEPEGDPLPIEETSGDPSDVPSTTAEPSTLTPILIQVIPAEEPIVAVFTANVINEESEPDSAAEEDPKQESAQPSSDNDFDDLRSQDDNLYQIATSDPQWQSLDSFRDDVLGDWSFQTLVVGAAVSTSLSLSVGYVFWTVRAGWLASALMTSMPVWRSVDPLPVLEYLNADIDQADDETLQSIIEQQAKKQPQIPGNEQAKRSTS